MYSSNHNSISALSAILAGVMLHLAYFHRGQHSARAPAYVAFVVLTLFASITGQTVLHQLPLLSALTCSLKYHGFVFLGLYGSVLCYRLLFHPLNRFPGPFAARLGDLWLTVQAKDFDWHRKSWALRCRYGEFVRIGSSTLLIMAPRGVPAMYGTKSGSHRAEWYSTFGAPYGIISPKPGVHRERRRIWSEALSNSALRGYEIRTQTYISKFLEVLGRHAETRDSFDATKWCSYFAWDVMGNLGLDKDFSLLSTGQEHWALTLMAGWTRAIGLRLPPWLINLLKAIPGSSNAAEKFDTYCNEQLQHILSGQEKENSGEQTSSLMGIMSSHAQSPPTKSDILHLQSDCRSVIFAGSDTSATTLTFIFYYLARYPPHIAKLRAELDPLLPNPTNPQSRLKHHDIQRLDHLNAVINEVLRLHPPGSVIPRQTPPGGIMVGDVFVPGDVTVIGSQYVVGRSEEAFVRAGEFLPERWYGEGDLIRDREGYAPFNVGPHWCVGRPLAMMYLRLAVAECVVRFDFGLLDREDGFLEEVQEAHTWRLAPLELLVGKREPWER